MLPLCDTSTEYGTFTTEDWDHFNRYYSLLERLEITKKKKKKEKVKVCADSRETEFKP